jgi:hypothetical protein
VLVLVTALRSLDHETVLEPLDHRTLVCEIPAIALRFLYHENLECWIPSTGLRPLTMRTLCAEYIRQHWDLSWPWDACVLDTCDSIEIFLDHAVPVCYISTAVLRPLLTMRPCELAETSKPWESCVMDTYDSVKTSWPSDAATAFRSLDHGFLMCWIPTTTLISLEYEKMLCAEYLY